jgi:predicted transcriptional regulator
MTRLERDLQRRINNTFILSRQEIREKWEKHVGYPAIATAARGA